MRAIILLRTNPGFQEKAYGVLKDISVKGIEPELVAHCFGRFDGVVICKYDDLKSLNAFAETLRREGVFHTETLIAID